MGIKKWAGAMLMAWTAGAMGAGAFELRSLGDRSIPTPAGVDFHPEARRWPLQTPKFRGDFSSQSHRWTPRDDRWLTHRRSSLDLVNHRIHVFRLQVYRNDGGLYRITMKRYGQGLADPYLLLSDEIGHVRAEDDDHGADPRNPNTRFDAKIETTLTPGVYYLFATSFRQEDSGYYTCEITRIGQ